MQNVSNSALMWIVLFPLAGAIFNGFYGKKTNKRLVGFVGAGTVAASFGLALVTFLQLLSISHAAEGTHAVVFELYEWFAVGLPGGRTAPVNVRFVMDSLSGVMTLFVTGIGFLIHVYSLGYMDDEDTGGFARFFTYLNLFMASMLILVLASSIPLMFVGWEGVGLCSYLLIGFYYENTNYAKAGRKAFVANRVGDFGALMGMFILLMATGSFEFQVINQSQALGSAFTVAGFPVGTLTVATAAALFLFLGCTGKSAQIPLFVWLPDAMAGPTPVSALIHAATMVTAGVYLCCRLSPVFIASEEAMALIAVVGTLTALLAASVAMVQQDMKKILAYSTVSQLGFMFAAVGCGAFAAGIFHVFTHAFFKACLFLGAGAVMHSVHAHGDANIFKLGGLKKHLPTERWTFLVSCLAIAGAPFFAGFFSKDEILLGAAQMAFHGGVLGDEAFGSSAVGWFVLIGLFLAATMTAFYMFRLYYLTFTGEYRSAGDGEGGSEAHGYDPHPHANPSTITMPLQVLGVGAIVAGFLGLPHVIPGTHIELPHLWGHWLQDTVASVSYGAGHGGSAPLVAMGLGLTAMGFGIFSATKLYRDAAGDPLFKPEEPGAFFRLVFDKWRIDELYEVVVLGPIRTLAVVVGWIDQTFVDALLTRAPSAIVRGASGLLTRLQTGKVHTYGLAMVVGVVGLTSWVTTPHVEVTHESPSATARFEASEGYGYRYMWTVGEGEGATTHEGRAVSHRYELADFGDLVLLVAGAPFGEDREVTATDEFRLLTDDDLGRMWVPADADVGRPSFAQRDGKIVIRPNGAPVNFERAVPDPDTGEITLVPGQRGLIGRTRVQVLPRASIELEVVNAFGRHHRETIEITLGRSDAAPRPAPAQAGVIPAGAHR